VFARMKPHPLAPDGTGQWNQLALAATVMRDDGSLRSGGARVR